MRKDENYSEINKEKLEQIKKQFEKLFAIKGYRLKDNFNSEVWFLKEDKTFQSYISSSTPMANESISKRIMDIFCSLNKSNNLKTLNINVGDFIEDISQKIVDANHAIQMSNINIQQNKTLEKIARLNEILSILSHKIESNQGGNNYFSTFRANVHSLKSFPKGQYNINLLFNNNFSKEEENEMNGTEKRNMMDKSIDQLNNLFENKKLKINKIIEVNSDEVTFRTQKGTYNKKNVLNEPNSFPEYKFVSLKKEGCKYILDRRYSGSTLSNFKVSMIINGNKVYETKNEFFFLYVLNYLFEDFCNINKDSISFECSMKAYEDGYAKGKNPIGTIDLEIILELDIITRAELLNRIREVFSLTVDTKEDNSNFIKEILSDYFPDIKESVEATLSFDGERNEDCCNPCIIY